MVEQDAHPVNGALARLIDGWCERRDLRLLATVLPAFTSNTGLTDGWAAVLEALYDLRRDRSLPPTERAAVERLVPVVEKMVYR